MRKQTTTTLATLVLLFQEMCPVNADIVDCGFFLSLSAGQTGQITSPNYPNDYPNSTRCIWRFQAPANYHVVLTAASMNGERRGGQCRDLIQFRNGSRDLAVLDEFCDTGFTVTSPARWLWVQFQSDSETTNSGFQATYSTQAAIVDISGVQSPVKICKSHEFKCGNQECLPFSYRCDGDNDCGCSVGCDEENCGGTGLDRGQMLGIGIASGFVLFFILFVTVTVLDRKHHNIFFKKMNDKKAESRRASRAPSSASSVLQAMRANLASRGNSTLGYGSRMHSTIGYGSRANSTIGYGIRANSTVSNAGRVNSIVGCGNKVNSTVSNADRVNSTVGLGSRANSTVGNAGQISSTS